MQIHELNYFNGDLDNAFMVADDGSDTGKVTRAQVVKNVSDGIDLANARIDNLISGVTVDSEVIDARVGANGKTYPSLGAAIRGQVGGLEADIDNFPYVVYSSANNTDGKYLNASGQEQTQNGWSITDYLAIGGKPVYNMPTRVTSDNVKSCFYDADKSFISAFKTDGEGVIDLVAPSNAKFVRFSILTSDANTFAYTSLLAIPYEDDIVEPNLIKGLVQTSSVLSGLITGSYYGTNGSPVISAGWSRTQLYPVNEGDVVEVYGAQGLYVVCFDSSKAFDSYKQTANNPQYVSFTVDQGVAFIGLNIVNVNIDSYRCLVNGDPLNEKYVINWLEVDAENTKTSIWYNKKYISHGDSITWQDGHVYGQGDQIGTIATGYQTVFSNEVSLASYTNEGKSGWAMAKVNGNGVVDTILSVADYTQYDLCTIACGTNDFKLNVPLGTLGIIGDTTFDDTTFYGAFRKAIEYILTNSPTIRLVLMTPLQRDNSGYDVNYTNSAGCKLIDYVNAVKAVGEMYGLPVCDMYANSGFTKKTLSTYTMDGLHPNDTGYLRMGRYLTGFLNAIGN